MTENIPFRPDKERIVELLFKENFEALCRLSIGYVSDMESAKDIVHDVFVRFWDKFESLPNESNYRSYLFKSVRNKSLNFLRDQKPHINVELVEGMSSEINDNSVEKKELEREIRFGLELLPEKCLEVFELSRFEGLKYQEIADRLNVSIKTVEAQMSKALKILRNHLKEFLSLIFVFLLN